MEGQKIFVGAQTSRRNSRTDKYKSASDTSEPKRIEYIQSAEIIARLKLSGKTAHDRNLLTLITGA
jgi:hypothetical protein